MIVNASQEIKRCLSMCINGRRGAGKSHFALEFSPRPVLIQPLDPTLRFILEKFDLTNVKMGQYPRLSAELTKAVSGIKKAAEIADSKEAFTKMQEEAQKVWATYSQDFYSALSWARTIIWDTGSEAWELLRLARHGKLTQIESFHYGALNSEFREMIRAAQDTGVNHIILQKMKEKWGETVSATGKVSRGPTGEWEPSGFSHIGYEVTLEGEVYQSLCTHQHPGPCMEGHCAYGCNPPCGADAKFHLRITKCTQNADLIFRDFADPNFVEIATEVYGKTSPEEWM